ncbi:hypothetical protein K6Y31_17045 [Motilimonas cestriensis]|uniref:Uncharacterized protein n=1 Tax=Motilimonas cestriensis TaxID=2742685 RepID=A0ABS8WE19_9GAMM|nr:hypothetical protein [Motilimonas cestriensis]MCE2596505.1 hypothetical protein [Motilimonas cestriensis]
MKYKQWIFIYCCLQALFPVLAGTVTVQKSTEQKPNPWALKQQILAENQWREQLKYQQGLNWLYQLPAGCISWPKPQLIYQCNGLFYRPYQGIGQPLFMPIDPPAEMDQANPITPLRHSRNKKGQRKPN